jgi:hypothetical protein
MAGEIKVRTGLLVLLLLVTSAASAQTKSADNYGFLSPNTRNDLTIDQAIKNLYSEEESKLIKEISDLGCRMRSRPRSARALGSWIDGAENSIVVQVKTGEPQIRYFLSRLGRHAKQKSVLYFHVQAAGPDRLYILKPRNVSKLTTIAKALDREGIAFRTLVPSPQGTFIYIVDLNGNELRRKVFAAARRLRSRVALRAGNGEFIGDNDDRQKASDVFDAEIKSYESSHAPIAEKCIRKM